MVLWVGAQGQINTGKETQNTPIWDVTHRETQIQNWNVVFSNEPRRLAESADGLNTSLALSPGELWLKESKTIYRLLRSRVFMRSMLG